MSDATPPPPQGGPPPPSPQAGPPAPEAQPPRVHAMLQGHQQTRTYPCTACGGELEFDIGQQRLKCPHCGNMQEFREASGAVEENDLRAALTSLRSNALAGAQVQALAASEKEVVCQNCGGHTTFSGTLTATRCPYCTTPIQRDDIQQAPERLPVDGVLPFQVDERTAKAKLEEWVSSRWFAPSEFKNYSDSGSFASVYTAYFTYDAHTSTDYQGERGEHYQVTVGNGDDQRTETRTRWHPVAGNVRNAFDDVPVMANEGGLNTKYIAQLEPWPMAQVKPYSPEFVAGHLSRTYDNDVEECFDQAKSIMSTQIEQTVQRDIGGDEQRVTNTRTTWSGLTFKHLLLPIWLLTVTFEGSTYQVMINGATGEVVGERPYSKTKIIGTVAAVIAVIVILVLVFGR